LTIKESFFKVTCKKSPAPMLKASANGAGIVMTTLSPCLNVLTTLGFMYDFYLFGLGTEFGYDNVIFALSKVILYCFESCWVVAGY